ncbi:MAG: hypothetical protein E7485_00690 [Ruminococcaceae bacterium]|nr:hypothetical protein [Oscillospiraceae bacterium]
MPDLHKFGIMPRTPQKGECFDSYEPRKYGCISVDGERIDAILSKLDEIEFFWHSVDVCGMGIAYCGITLISPTSAKKMIDILPHDEAFISLIKLLERAISQDKFVIHYGL